MSFAQDAKNIAVTTTDEKLIVTYDLPGQKNAIYDVSVHFKKEDGSIIKPENIIGDIGKIEAGEGKAVIWYVYKDVDGLSGAIEPIIRVNEVVVNKKKKDKTQPTPKPPSSSKDKPIIDVNPNKKPNSTSNKKRKKRIELRKKKYRYGYKVGLGSSKEEASLRRDSFAKLFSWQMGGYYRWNFSRRLYLQPELLYHNQSFTENLNVKEHIDTRLHYGRIQLLAGASPFNIGGIHFNAGLYYGYLMGGKEKQFLEDGTIESSLQNMEVRNGEDSPYNRNDLGYLVGGTLNFRKGAFAIGFLMSQGFESIANNNYLQGIPERENIKLTNRSWHISIQKMF